jgi:3-deoxy-manno-octulosonate cytidylyltransferase (CMP-KDO synthetase)
MSELTDYVIVATDSEKIRDEVAKFGGQVQMTSENHHSGTDRIAEVVRNNPDIKIAVNVQGDEPLISPQSIDLAVKCILDDQNVEISTLVREIDDEKEVSNPNIVKAVLDNKGFALYFSRSPIPYQRNPQNAKLYAHIGLYVYRRESLLEITDLPQSYLEKTESLEQLRALQNGFRIKTAIVNYKPVGIDTSEDLKEFESLLKN